MLELSNIHIFISNIQSQSDKEIVSAVLNNHPEIHQWSIDQDDVDCVLRVVSNTLASHQIIELLSHHNFTCTELY